MDDLREKVIKGLECCILRDPDDKQRCSECPYEGNCVNRLKQDALSLLKAQEEANSKVSIPVEETYRRYKCGKCGNTVVLDDRFCRKCGKEIDWIGRN